ncbi:IS630 family transposase [Hahella sp. NBU794]|uniref:IS630 family transposase n=1 Tax=Hahella sp. NBU794 TaxID=3422590 RepID=UPI003D6E4DF5
MPSNDGRKLDHKTLEVIRIRAVQQVQAGESPEAVIRALGFSRPRIYEWLAAYREGGYDALKAKRLYGRPRKLNGRQLRQIYTWVVGYQPQQFKFEYALWTRGLVRDLIKRKFRVSLSDVSVGRLLRAMGLTPQKPLFRAYQQDPDRVARWKQEEYPRIRQLAKAANAEILFADEASIRSDYHSGTTWSIKGLTPEVKTTGARFGLNLISAVSARGEFHFKVIEGKLNAESFIGFLEDLTYKSERPVFLIVDGHPAHQARKVKEYLATQEGRLQLFFLPPYSPELNPDESVWSYLKHQRLGKMKIAGPDQLRKMALKILRSMKRTPSLIQSLFRHPELKYIMA